MATVVIIGPNISQPSGDPTFHIHAPGCKDIKARKYARAEGGNGDWVTDADTLADLAIEIYDPSCFLYDPADPAELKPYADDIKIFNCVKGVKK